VRCGGGSANIILSVKSAPNMTYCVAALVEQGIVFASDSRTNAGVDQVATYSKMYVFEEPGERVVVILTAGNLASSQSVMELLRMRMREESGKANPAGILGPKNFYFLSKLVGETVREVITRDETLAQEDVDLRCNLIVGGQIAGERPRLFRIYPQGNFIEATQETGYFQLGETKYGKPIIDRVVHYDTALKDVAKCILVSFDSTMRSNLTVGLPIDLLTYNKDSLQVTHRRRIAEGDKYFSEISRYWSAGLRRAFAEVPDVELETPEGET